MAVSATEVDNIVVRLIGDATSYQKMIDNAITSTDKATQKIQQSSRDILSISNSIGMLAASMSSLIQATAGTANTLTAFSEFDRTMTESIAIMQVTDSQIQRMRKSALDLAPAAGLGPEVLGRGFYFLASAGLSAENAISALPTIVNFAVAGNFDLAKATTLASDAQAALGLKVKDAAKNLENLTRVTDVLVRGNTLSNTTTEQLSLALSTGAAAAAKVFGKSLEEVTAGLAVYADQGIKAQVAGNALSRVFRLLQYSGVTHAAQLKKLGIEIFDETGKMKPLADIVENLEKVLGGYSDASRGAALETIGFEARVQQAILPLIGSSQKLREYEKALKDAGGTTERVADITRTSFSFQMRALSANIKVLAVEIGSFFAPALALVSRILNSTISAWRSMSDEVKNSSIAVGTFLLTMAGLGPLRAILAALGGVGVAAIMPIISLFATLAGVIINPFRLLFLWFNPTFIAFRYLITIISAVVVSLQEMGGMEEGLRKLEEVFIGMVEWLKPIGQALLELGTTIVNKVLQGITHLGNATLVIFQTLANNINITWSDIQYGIISGIKLIEFVLVNLGNIATLIGKGISYVFSPLKDIFQSTGEKASIFAMSLDEIIKHTIVITTIVTALIISWKILASIFLVVGTAIGGVVTAFKVLGTVISIMITILSPLKIIVMPLLGVLGLLTVALLELAIVGGKALIAFLVDLVIQIFFFIKTFGLAGVMFLVILPIIILYNAVIAITKIAMAGLTLAITIFETVMALGVVSILIAIGALTAFVAVIFIVQGAIYLLTGLFSIVSIGLLSIVTLALTPIAAMLTYIVAPIVGVYLALYTLTEAIQSIPTDTGPIAGIVDTFQELLGVMGLVIRAIRVDMDLAWKIFEVGVLMGIERIKAMWPGLWAFIKEGWVTVGTLFRSIMDATFFYIEGRIKLATNKFLGLVSEEDALSSAKMYGEIFERAIKKSTGIAGKEFAKSAKGFSFTDTEDFNKFKAQIGDLKKQLENLEEDKFFEDMLKALEETEDPVKKLQKQIEKLKEEMAKDDSLRIKKTKHEVDNLTASIVGTAEAMTRLQHYTDLFFLDQGKLANLNQEGVQSGLKALGIKEEYKPSGELVGDEKILQDVYNQAFNAAEIFINTIRETDWETVLEDLSLTVSGIAQDISSKTKTVYAAPNFADEAKAEQEQRDILITNLIAEIESRSVGIYSPDSVAAHKSDKEVVDLLARLVEVNKEIADKNFWDVVESGGLEA